MSENKSRNSEKIIKESNRMAILNALRILNETTIDEVKHFTNLSMPTVRNVISRLMDENAIVRCGRSESTGGRLANLLRINGKYKYSIGVYFDSTRINVILANLNNDKVYSCKGTCYPNDDINTIKKKLFSLLDEALINSNIIKDQILKICIGIPGFIDRTSGTILAMSHNRSWRNVNICDIISKKYGIETVLINNIHMCGYAEKLASFKNTTESFIYVNCSEQIQAALCFEGEIFFGDNGNSGIIDVHTYMLENENTLISGYWEKTLGSVISKTIFIKELNIDMSAVDTKYSLLMRSADFLASKLLQVVMFSDVYNIVLGGPYDKSCILLAPFVHNAIQNRLPSFLSNSITVKASAIDYDDEALGGCAYITNLFFNCQ
ncbi:MAG: ROK family protein [Eubacteriales bacterium]|nr:ROK family protein [Eubacteriales bacterium]